MPGFDGTGPLGRGPMTGLGRGFCVLASSAENPDRVKGFAGFQGVPVGQVVENVEDIGKEVINVPYGDGTGPAGLGPMTGRAAGFCAWFGVPGYMNPVVGRAGLYGAGVPAIRPYGAGSYGYGIPYGGRVNPWLRRGFGFGRGFGRGRRRGRGRFGFWR
jgi:hypothetical protein